MSESDYQLIEQYLRSELADEALHDFEQRLKSDVQLAKELALAKEMDQFVKNRTKTNETISMMKEMGKKYQPKPEAVVVPFYKKRKVIIATLMGTAAIFLLFFFSNIFNNDPYQEFFQHQPIAAELSGDEINMSQAIKDYNNENYKSALPVLENNEKINGSKNSQYELAQGICYLELGQFQKANSTFTHLLETQQIYKNQATWYLALTALKQNDFQKSRELLTQIESESAYFKKAEQLQQVISSK